MDGNFFFFRTKDSYLRKSRKFRNAMTTSADSVKQKLCFEPKAQGGLNYAALWAGTRKELSPVIRLEMMRGRMSIFSILMRMSPGKAINMTTSGWMGDARRSSPPHTAPRMTPGEEGRAES